MGFHRLTDPPADYVLGGAGTLPPSYDYINNDPDNGVGTGANQQANADSAVSTLYNTGSYFIAWQEDAISKAVNRGLKALAENTDYLDELFRRRLGLNSVKSVTITSGNNYVQLTGHFYCGELGVDDPARLFSVVTKGAVTFQDAFAPSGGSTYAWLYVQDVRDSAGAGSVVGDGWVENPRVYFNFSPTANFPCYILGMERGALYSAEEYHLGDYNPRRAVVDGSIQDRFVRILGGSAERWTDAQTSSIHELSCRGLDDLYRVNPIGSLTPFEAGAGGTITRDAQALRVEVPGGSVDRNLYDVANASFISDLVDVGWDGSGAARSNTSIGSSGFVALGSRWGHPSLREVAPTIATFMSLIPQRDTQADADLYTSIPVWSDASIINDGLGDSFTLTLAGTGAYPDAFFWNQGTAMTAVVTRRDLIEVNDGTTKRVFVIQALDPIDSTLATLVPLDGGCEAGLFLVPTNCTIRWIQTQMYVGQGAPGSKFFVDGDPVLDITDAFDGLYMVRSPVNGALSLGLADNPVAFFGADVEARKALSVGVFDSDPSDAKFTETFFVQGDGLVSAVKFEATSLGVDSIVSEGGVKGALFTAKEVGLASSATEWNVSLGSCATITNPTAGSSSFLSLTLTGMDSGGVTYQLAVVRDATNLMNKLVLPDEVTENILSESDSLLSPPVVGKTVVDLYTGKQVGLVVYWSVERFEY